MIIVVLVFGLLPRQTQPCHGSGPQTIEGIAGQGDAQAGDKQGKMANKTEGSSHLKEERIKFDPKPSGLSIYEEERILKFMEEQEISLESGEVY